METKYVPSGGRAARRRQFHRLRATVPASLADRPWAALNTVGEVRQLLRDAEKLPKRPRCIEGLSNATAIQVIRKALVGQPSKGIVSDYTWSAACYLAEIP